MILSAQSIIARSKMIEPFHSRTVFMGMSYGLSSAGYDVRIAQAIRIEPNGFVLASTIERFDLPHDILGRVCDKSSLARQGLCVQNTILEPGWCGHITLELTNHSINPIDTIRGMPIAQVLFELLDEPTVSPYNGKYQDQPDYPVTAKSEP